MALRCWTIALLRSAFSAGFAAVGVDGGFVAADAGAEGEAGDVAGAACDFCWAGAGAALCGAACWAPRDAATTNVKAANATRQMVTRKGVLFDEQTIMSV